MNSVSVYTPLIQEVSSFSGSRGRQRSHSYNSPEDCKNYGVQIQKEETCLRPRTRYGGIYIHHCSYIEIANDCVLLFQYWINNIKIQTKFLRRSFYSFETSELHYDSETEPLIQNTTTLQQNKVKKKGKKEGDGATVRLSSKKSSSNKILLSRELNGKVMPWWSVFLSVEFFFSFSQQTSTSFLICPCKTSSGSRGNLKSVAMITISESDNWEINSSSGMKYGQFVDWEKIDPDAASKYQEILKSSHHQLKAMGRAGFWTMPHTLRAKAYYHIIHGINSRLALFQNNHGGFWRWLCWKTDSI